MVTWDWCDQELLSVADEVKPKCFAWAVRTREKPGPLFAAATRGLRPYCETQIPALTEEETSLAWRRMRR